MKQRDGKVFDILPMGSGFLPKETRFLRVLVDFWVSLYIRNIGFESEFIQAINESNHALKTTKQLSALTSQTSSI